MNVENRSGHPLITRCTVDGVIKNIEIPVGCSTVLDADWVELKKRNFVSTRLQAQVLIELQPGKKGKDTGKKTGKGW